MLQQQSLSKKTSMGQQQQSRIGQQQQFRMGKQQQFRMGNQQQFRMGNQQSKSMGNQGGNQGSGTKQGGNKGWGGNQGGNQGSGENKGGNNGCRGNQGGWGGNQGCKQGSGRNQGNNGRGGDQGWRGNQGGNNGWPENQGGNQGGNQGCWGGNQNSSQQWSENLGFINGASQWGNNLDGDQWIKQQMKRQYNFNFFDPNDSWSHKFANMIQKQVIFLEPSPSQKILEELKRTGKTFRDDRFPANQKSLTGQYGPQFGWANIKWDRVSVATPGAKLFSGKCEPKDIRQGNLGDCYFLAALAALAERPDRIFNLFLIQEQNPQKYYSVKLLYQGKWITIDMDEYIPYLYNEPAFTKAKDGQLWVVMLEKAWAKMYSNYKRIEAGYPEEGLHDLTGAPIHNIYLKQGGFDKERDWQYLLQASKKQYAMVTSSQPGSDTYKSVRGVVQGHAYTLLNATYLNFQGQNIRLIQLRNPWGKGQSKADWCDKDPKWNMVDPNEKKRLGYTLDQQDGIFFMTYDHFIEQFRSITIAQINDSASYVYLATPDPQNKGVFFKVQVPKPGMYSFQLDKTPERSYLQSELIQKKFQYPSAKIQIGKYQNGSLQKLQSVYNNRRTTSKNYNLQPGNYIVRANIDYNKDLEKDFDVNLAIYGDCPCNITFANNAQARALQPGTDWTGNVQKSQGEWNDLGNDDWDSNKGGNQVWENNNQGWERYGNNNGW